MLHSLRAHKAGNTGGEMAQPISALRGISCWGTCYFCRDNVTGTSIPALSGGLVYYVNTAPRELDLLHGNVGLLLAGLVI